MNQQMQKNMPITRKAMRSQMCALSLKRFCTISKDIRMFLLNRIGMPSIVIQQKSALEICSVQPMGSCNILRQNTWATTSSTEMANKSVTTNSTNRISMLTALFNFNLSFCKTVQNSQIYLMPRSGSPLHGAAQPADRLLQDVFEYDIFSLGHGQKSLGLALAA